MIRQIAPQFFTTDIPGTVAYYKDKLGFECLGTWQDPPVYAIVARDQHAIHFRRKPLVEAALKSWTSDRLVKAMTMLGEASLEARLQSDLSEAIARRALTTIARSAAQRG